MVEGTGFAIPLAVPDESALAPPNPAATVAAALTVAIAPLPARSQPESDSPEL